MSRAAEFNGWCIVTGVDFRERFFVKDPTLSKIPNPDYDPNLPIDGTTNRKEIFQPKDLTGYTAKMDIRQSIERTSPIIKSLETGNGITIDGALGSVELFIDNAETNVAPILGAAGTEGFYDIFLIPPAPTDDNEVPLFGEIKIRGTTTDV